MNGRTVTVRIVSVSSEENPPTTWLKYRVQNDTNASVWLVDDGWLIWHQKGKKIELSYARAKLRPGAQVFGYFPPNVVKIEPGDSVLCSVKLTWPQLLDQLWNEKSNASPPPGEYKVSVRVGYGFTPEPEAPSLGEGVEAPVLHWQKEAISQDVPMKVSSYKQ